MRTSSSPSVSPGTSTYRIQIGVPRSRSRRPNAQRRRELAAGDRPVGLRQAGLDVEQHEVDGVEQLVLGSHAEEPGRVERGVQRPAPCTAAARCVTNGRWISGSPPESVTPPCMTLSAAARRAIRSVSSSRVVSRPSRICQVSGLWQYRQRRTQPDRNTVRRVPGPSTPVTSSQECTRPTVPARTAASSADRSSGVVPQPATPATVRTGHPGWCSRAGSLVRPPRGRSATARRAAARG